MEGRRGLSKCRACRDKRRALCVKAPGSSKCSRCLTLGLLCVTPLSTQSDAQLTPGQYFKALLRPTSLKHTRMAVTRLLEDLMQLKVAGGQLPEQIRGVACMAMLRARAANDVALLHAAVSVCAALHVEESIDTITDDDETEWKEVLAAEADEFILRRQAVDGIPAEGLAVVRQVTHSGVRKVTCNDLFKEAFFDAAEREISAIYFDLSAALVDDESQDVLKALDERVAQQALFEEVPRTRSGMCVITATSETPMVLVGKRGERMIGTLRLDCSWPADGSVSVSHVMVIGLREDKGSSSKTERSHTPPAVAEVAEATEAEEAKEDYQVFGSEEEDSFTDSWMLEQLFEEEN